MINRLRPLFRPKSIAIVGASNNPRKRGYQAIQSLQRDGFRGSIFPVNQKEESILGLPVVPDVADLDNEIDLALIATPATSVPGILKICGEKKIRSAIVLAVGFGEAGKSGKKLQEEIVKISRDNDILIVGPNTSGMFNLHHQMNLTGIRDIPKGSMAILSQSGNMALSLITEIKANSKAGFSSYVGVGNEAGIQFHEYLSYFKDDPSTSIIVMFVDGMRNGRKFLQVAKETSDKKPIVLLKSGRSEKGRQAARSHTGALAGLSAVSKTAFNRAGIITIDHSDELFPAAESLMNFAPLRKNRTGIISDGGGHSALAADALADYGIMVPDLSPELRTKFRTVLPTTHAIENPLDLAGTSDANPGVFADCVDVMIEDSRIDVIMIVGLFGGYHIRFSESMLQLEEETAHRIGKAVRRSGKPVMVHSLYASHRPSPLEILKEYGIPVHDSIDLSAKCISVLDEYGKHLSISQDKTDFVLKSEGKQKPAVLRIFKKALEEKRKGLLETEARDALRLHGIPVCDYQLATTEDEAINAARSIGFPVAMKIVSKDIIHKSEVGGVLLNIKNDDSVRDGFDLLVARARRNDPGVKINGVLVTPMMPPGIEVVLGVTQDPQFGPVIMFGLGGVMVEVLKDVSFRVLPLGRFTAPTMLNEIRAHSLLDGFRGKPPCDKGALTELLVQLSDFVEAYHFAIAELDLNPVIVYEKGLSVIDARMFLQ
ncbi:MAG: acetate--CoA ligase family protein [Ignavibacteria bacterium]|nr:acetate--CoA ligase family protein [Ignavibacteria bacterium]